MRPAGRRAGEEPGEEEDVGAGEWGSRCRPGWVPLHYIPKALRTSRAPPTAGCGDAAGHPTALATASLEVVASELPMEQARLWACPGWLLGDPLSLERPLVDALLACSLTSPP